MRKNKAIFIIIFLIVVVIICQLFLKQSTYVPDKLFTTKELRQDFLKTRKILENNNPTLYYFHSEEILDRYFDDIAASIDTPMFVKDFFILLNRVVTKANCGHTYLELPEGYWEKANKIYKHIPLKFYFQDGRAFVLEKYNENLAIPLGAEVLSVNDLAMSEIINNFLEMTSSDGLNQTYKYAKMNRKSYGLFPGYPDFPGSYKVVYTAKKDSIEKEVVVEALTHQQIFESKIGQMPTDWEYVPYKLNIIDSLNTAILTVENFVDYRTKEFEKYLADRFESIYENKIQNLIIDVRNNDGGDPSNATAVLSYIADEPYIYFPPHVLGYWSLKKTIEPHPFNFKGNVYVLMDGGCFSTTGHFLSMVKHHRWATLIGEESGGSYICNGCVENFTLPNTKIILHCARCVYRTNVHGFTRERGILPDIELKPEIEDLIKNKDTLMEFVLKIVKR